MEAARTFLSWIGRLGVGGPGAPPCAFPIRYSGLGEANPRRNAAAAKTDHKKARDGGCGYRAGLHKGVRFRVF